MIEVSSQERWNQTGGDNNFMC